MTQVQMNVGDERHGFRLEQVIPLAELNATLYRLEHPATGARYLHLATADDNNLFAVGFRTPPRDSTGAPHILEHTVLCGSRRYPVRDPFFSMLKRSLSTFMNAMTADDWTLYPFSSQNRTDFYNLMGVYLDATFFPLLRELDFRQEGHRLEFTQADDPSSPLLVKGVVYNEMKGHMSDPHSLLGSRLHEALYPTAPYRFNAGGEPAHIPDLTWEELRAFHAECYHPSNAYFFSYGDLPLEPHLAMVAEQALAHFERRAVHTAVGSETRLDAPQRVTARYPVEDGEPTAGKTMVQVAWLTCDIGDSTERVALGLLSTLLLGNPAAPLHQALLESRLGANLAPGTGYNDENRDTSFAAGLQGTEPERTGEIEALVLDTLRRVAGEGFPAERVDAAIHQMELAHREVRGDHYPYALGLLSRLMGPWIHGADPARPLQLTEDLRRLRREVERGPYFQELIRRHLLDNPHRVTLTLAPDPSVREEEARELAVRLQGLQERLDAGAAQNLVEEAAALQRSQETPEDLSVLPTLELTDIPRRERPVASRRGDRGGVPVWWFAQPTNGIGYFSAQVDLAALAADQRAVLPLFCATVGRIGAAGAPYTAVAERLSATTGGVHAGV
ncbi:MAG TPA: insulinase family protein, partial [Deferrisomatales bacterium]|nr:insulinase family protein [Deferrisomatales bacterium]